MKLNRIRNESEAEGMEVLTSSSSTSVTSKGLLKEQMSTAEIPQTSHNKNI